MIQDARLAVPAAPEKWLGLPLNTFIGTVDEIATRIPRFTRTPFALKNNGQQAKENPYLDMIVREPFNGHGQRIPVGVVSKSYTLLQHENVFDRAIKAIKAADIILEEVRVHLKLTEHGERMALQFLFPDDFSVTPRDGHSMSLRLQCLNSVDGSHAFDATLGWFRLVCSNGLVLGVKERFRKAHTEYLDVRKIEDFLQHGIADAKADQRRLQEWEAREIRREVLRKWVDGPLCEAWGVKAAARACHITLTGCDAELVMPFEKLPPSQRTIKLGAKVPGATFQKVSAFSVSQALSWLARESHEFREHLKRERQIRPLIQQLIALN